MARPSKYHSEAEKYEAHKEAMRKYINNKYQTNRRFREAQKKKSIDRYHIAKDNAVNDPVNYDEELSLEGDSDDEN